MIRKQGISLLLSAIMAFSLCACGQEVQQTAGSQIELVEPVSVANNVEKAARRNIYDCQIYSATVYPSITEYSFDKNMQVDGRGAFWGDSVKKGDTLIYADTEEIDKKIEDMEKRIAEMDEAMTEELQNLNDTLAEPIEEEKRLATIVEIYKNAEPEEMIPAPKQETETDKETGESAEGSQAAEQTEQPEMIKNPAYETWYKENEMWTGKYRILAHNIDMQEEAYRQHKELYDLERAYLAEQLADMKKERSSSILKAKEDGVVVAKKMGEDYGTYTAQPDQALVAVGNMDVKVLKSDYINKAKAASAKDLYAVIDGVRYEVEYHPMDNDEYTKLTEGGGKAYSTLTLLGDTGQVNVGDFATVCLFSKKNEDVLSIPKEAIHKDGSNFFVYVMKNGESVVTTVKIGITDGVYTEILSGINEGDEVVVETERKFSDKTVKVAYGSFKGSYSDKGKLDGSQGEAVLNPVEYGTTYFGEYKVQYLQHVEKGDVIATVRVVKDEIAIQRQEQKILRAQERLADLKEAGEEDNKKAIQAKEEEIAELKELLEDMENDGKTVEIKATKSGMITGLVEYESETILYKDSYVAGIADETSIYISVPNENQTLNYGSEVSISFTTYDGRKRNCTGIVSNVSDAGLSKELQSEKALIKVSKEDLPDVLIAMPDGYDWRDPKPYEVKATTREMNNVLVVPRSAVTEKDGCTYVNVKDEQGNIKACRFVAGGYDNTNYWVIEGLSEGMVLCLK